MCVCMYIDIERGEKERERPLKQMLTQLVCLDSDLRAYFIVARPVAGGSRGID